MDGWMDGDRERERDLPYGSSRCERIYMAIDELWVVWVNANITKCECQWLSQSSRIVTHIVEILVELWYNL